MKKQIHINQHNIRSNIKLKSKDRLPVITCKTYKSNTKANRLEILDADGEIAATVIYSPDKPLSCGARVWIETKNDVRMPLREPVKSVKDTVVI